MRYFFSEWPAIHRKLTRGKRRVFLFDVDGTLAPIVPSPQKAKISNPTKSILRRLSRKKNTRIGILSGRSLKDARRMVGLKGIIYSGNHGLEIQTPKARFVHPAAKNQAFILSRLIGKFGREFKNIPGVIIEDKGFSISIHFRKVLDPFFMKAAKRIFLDRIKPVCDRADLFVRTGKKVWEILPSDIWNKGSAAQFLCRKVCPGAIPLFVGDDVTDEDAFAVFKKTGITVRVGRNKHSSAAYYIKSQKEMERLLNLLTL